MQETAPGTVRDSPYICGYDGAGADISVTCVLPRLRPPKGVFDRFVASLAVIYSIVGNVRPD